MYIAVPATTEAPTPPPGGDCPVDIIFVVDESGSVTSDNFNLVKTFLSKLVESLDIDSGNTRVGLVTYSDVVSREGFNLNDHSSVTSVKSAIMNLDYSGGTTNTAAALAHVRTTMLTSPKGDRPNVPNVIVVLTDGLSDDIDQTKVSII